MSQKTTADMSWLTEDPTPGKPLFGSAYTETETRIIERWQRCHTIAREAWSKGLNVTPMCVNRHYRWFKLWYSGGLATGHLMKATGIKQRTAHLTKQKGTR